MSDVQLGDPNTPCVCGHVRSAHHIKEDGSWCLLNHCGCLGFVPAGPPSTRRRRTISIMLPIDLTDRLARVADERVMGRNKLIEILCEKGLDRLEAEDG